MDGDILMTYLEIYKILSAIIDPVEKLELVMELGKLLPDIPRDSKCYEITGCTSFVKICIQKDHKIYGFADSALVKGIVYIIISMIEGKKISEIKNMDLLKLFNDLNLKLGTGRINGVQSIISFLQNL